MKKVKFFDCRKVEDLENKINDFLNNMNTNYFLLIDIKFNSYHNGGDLPDYHTAMIIYEI